MALSCPIDLDVAKLREEIESIYARVAADPSGDFHFHRGAEYAANLLGYDRAELAKLPAETTASFAGVGNPFVAGKPATGATVVDIGSGAGTDALLAANYVGPTGRVIGVDPTDPMLGKARAAADQVGAKHAEFRKGSAEALPVDSDSIDLVISNGVINLAPDKVPVFAEILRVLKPGGRLQLTDIIMASELSEKARRDIDLWTGWIAGALLEAELINALGSAGFVAVELRQRYDCFAGTSKEHIARKFGVIGVTVVAAKPV